MIGTRCLLVLCYRWIGDGRGGGEKGRGVAEEVDVRGYCLDGGVNEGLGVRDSFFPRVTKFIVYVVIQGY